MWSFLGADSQCDIGHNHGTNLYKKQNLISTKNDPKFSRIRTTYICLRKVLSHSGQTGYAVGNLGTIGIFLQHE